MGTISARAVIGKAQTIIQDADGIRWPLDEVLGWLNSGQRAIVEIRPDASSTSDKVQLDSGTKQVIPDGHLRILDIVRNLGADGDTPGRSIRLIEREILDAQIPDWHDISRANVRVLHWVYDERSPKVFYVYPPQPVSGRGYVEMLTSTPPRPCTLKEVVGEDAVRGTDDSPIYIDDIFENPLIDWICYRSFLKETKYTVNGKADSFYQRFLAALGVKTETDKRFTARRAAPPHVNPNIPGNTGAFGDN